MNDMVQEFGFEMIAVISPLLVTLSFFIGRFFGYRKRKNEYPEASISLRRLFVLFKDKKMTSVTVTSVTASGKCKKTVWGVWGLINPRIVLWYTMIITATSGF